MANFWTAPKLNWTDNDGIGYADFNRIEQNISAVKDGTFRYVQGFGFTISNAVVGQDGVITIYPGSAYSSGGVPMRLNSVFVKNIKSWTQGNGATSGGMAAAVTVAAHTWYYMFVLTNPIDGSIEIMFDDNPFGTNVSDIVYTEKRFIGCFMTAAAGADSSFDIREMYSLGDGNTFMNPTDIYSEGCIVSSGSLPNNAYQLMTLTNPGGKPPLPAIVTTAKINVITNDSGAAGLINSSGLFSIPTNLEVGTTDKYNGDFIMRSPTSGSDSYSLEMVINASSQIYVAMRNSPSTMELRIYGYYTDRII